MSSRKEAKYKDVFEGICKDKIGVVRIIKSTTYAFGSELNTLRLYKFYSKYPPTNTEVRQGFSPTYKSFYFALEEK